MITAKEETINYGLLPELAGFSMRRAYFIATQLFATHHADQKITPIQFAILEIVDRNASLSQKEIAEYIGTAPSVIVRPIRVLEERDIIHRERSEADRRIHRLSLTASGEQLIQAMRIEIETVENDLLVGLNSAERKTLVNLLNKVIAAHD